MRLQYGMNVQSAHFLINPIFIKDVVEIRLAGVGEGMKRIAEQTQVMSPLAPWARPSEARGWRKWVLLSIACLRGVE